MTHPAHDPAPSGPPEPQNGADSRFTPVVIAQRSALELLLTAVLLFGVVTIVRWVAGPSPSRRPSRRSICSSSSSAAVWRCCWPH
ncbi:hypothetical protein [Streptomyces nodosus]|uniref:hypothetical protein n=1 Tax=Streptomyces nodosus TaxID=40318 RepID=UPI0037F9CECA